MPKISFAAIFRYIPACQEWRFMDIDGEDTIQEFRFQTCSFMNNKISNGLNKNKDNPVVINIHVKDNDWLRIARAFKKSNSMALKGP